MNTKLLFLTPHQIITRKCFEYVLECDAFFTRTRGMTSTAADTVRTSGVDRQKSLPDLAATWKLKGNVCFMEERVEHAVGCFTAAIHLANAAVSTALPPPAAVSAPPSTGAQFAPGTPRAAARQSLPTPTASSISKSCALVQAALANRALCFLRLKRFVECVEDCSRVLQSNPRHVKSRLRRAQALERLGYCHDALDDIEQLLSLSASLSSSSSSQCRESTLADLSLIHI